MGQIEGCDVDTTCVKSKWINYLSHGFKENTHTQLQNESGKM